MSIVLAIDFDSRDHATLEHMPKLLNLTPHYNKPQLHVSPDSVLVHKLGFSDSNSNTPTHYLIYIFLAYFELLVMSFWLMTPNHQMA